MFRKIRSILRNALLVGLTLAAVGTGVAGDAAGSGRLRFQKMWFRGEEGTTSVRWVWVSWGANRWIHVHHLKYMDAPATCGSKRRSGTGWIYRARVAQNVPTGYYFRSYAVAVHPAIALALSVLLAGYPSVAFIRGPLRRWRRPKEGMCLKCGYDLRGTPERCPECGRAVEGG